MYNRCKCNAQREARMRTKRGLLAALVAFVKLVRSASPPAPDGLQVLDLSQGRQCLSTGIIGEADALTSAVALDKLFRTLSVPPINVEVSNWASAEAISAMATIIMTERLGHTVRTFRAHGGGEPVTNTYQRIETSKVHINFELWPMLEPKKTQRLQAQSAFCSTPAGDLNCVNIAGESGYLARSGWFIPNVTLPGTLHVDGRTIGRNDSGVFTQFNPNAGPNDELAGDLWQSIKFLQMKTMQGSFVSANEVCQKFVSAKIVSANCECQ